MIVLIVFAFLAGVVTVLSPCILPLLPVILSATDTTGKQRPLGVVLGFILSFTFFTLFLSTMVRLSGIPADSLRVVSIIILALFGLSLLIPQIQARFEILFSRFANLAPDGQNKHGFFGGLLVGCSLGLLWTPCVGPILASVISLAITGTVTTQAVIITLAYAAGTAIPLFMIMLAGSTALQRVPWLVRNTGTIQKAFGVLMILTALAIYFNLDRRFQTYILSTFPQYGVGLTQIEDRAPVREQLQQLNSQPFTEEDMGKSLSELRETGVAAPALIPGGEWFNTEALTLAELRGKVVLIDFWTYTCINCQRTFPYLRDWWEKYEDDGLVIIGVHSPEFEFEKDPENVEQALHDFSLTYPVMQDNNFATWRAYNNRYWPAKYLIDAEGRIRYTHFGEGAYDETERVIQELLQEAGAQPTESVSNPGYTNYARTPELYLGYARMEYLTSPEVLQPDTATEFSLPNELPPNGFAFEGEWLISPEYAAPSSGSKLHLNFEAKQVFLVARPTVGGEERARSARIFLDGNLHSTLEITSDQLYTVLELENPGRHTLTIEFTDGEVELYAFTFG